MSSRRSDTQAVATAYEDGEDDFMRTRGNERIANHYYNQDGQLYYEEEDDGRRQ